MIEEKEAKKHSKVVALGTLQEDGAGHYGIHKQAANILQSRQHLRADGLPKADSPPLPHF
jgi:hypothetical protein